MRSEIEGHLRNGFGAVVPVRSSHERPRLCVVVDTEEEFDWYAPFSRANTSVTAMRHVDRIQVMCARFELRPTYVIDYPVAATPEGHEQLADWAQRGQCIVGAHLHPWVNPPYEEALSIRNSFTCNLPQDLQDAKIGVLEQTIQENVGVKPLTFKAGRYGVGADILRSLAGRGFVVDASVNPTMNYQEAGGPDFSDFTSNAFWFGEPRMLEVPCTHAFTGWARAAGRSLRTMAEQKVLRAIRMPGILARLRVVNQIMLSPEGNTFEEMAALTRVLLQDGLRVFTLSLHSPSVVPGHTPYVRSESDLKDFLQRMERYFEFFFGEIGGQPSTPEDFRRDLLGMAKAT